MNMKSARIQHSPLLLVFLLLGCTLTPLATIPEPASATPLATVELSTSVGAKTPLGDTVLTGYSANYTATRTVAAVERDVLLPVESIERDENFLPVSHDSQYFVAWLESDETKWEPHSHLMNDAHALMWLKASEQGPIGPETGSVLQAGQQYGFIASHGSLGMGAPPYLPNSAEKGDPFLELAGPVVTQTQGVSNTGASDMTGVVMAGFAGFKGGDYDFDEDGAATLHQEFTLPEAAVAAGEEEKYSYTYAWIRPRDTDVDVNFDLDFAERKGTLDITFTRGYWKEARELMMPSGVVQRYWGVVFSLYLYLFPSHQGADEGLIPCSRLLWAQEEGSLGELTTGGPWGEESWSDVTGGFGLQLRDTRVEELYLGNLDRARVGNESGGEEDTQLTGRGQISYELDTNYLNQGFVAITNITPWGHDEPIVDAYGMANLVVEGEDNFLTNEWLVDHSAVAGVWVFGFSIGWITMSPTIQNNGNPSCKSDSWWWIYDPGGATINLAFKYNDEVFVMARIMIRPHETFADIVIEAGAFTLDSEEREMKIFQHLDPHINGTVNYGGLDQDEEFGPLPAGTRGDVEYVEVEADDGETVRWTPSDEGGLFGLADHDDLVTHPSQGNDGEPITDQDIRFYTEMRNFGGETYRAYEVAASSQLRIDWGGEDPVTDLTLQLPGKPGEIEIGETLELEALVTNSGNTRTPCYLWLTIDGEPAAFTTLELDAGAQEEVKLEWTVGERGEGILGVHNWTNFTLRGEHDVHLEIFPVGYTEEEVPSDNYIDFKLKVGDADEEGFLQGGGGALLGLLGLFVVVGAALFLWKQREGRVYEEDEWEDFEEVSGPDEG